MCFPLFRPLEINGGAGSATLHDTFVTPLARSNLASLERRRKVGGGGAFLDGVRAGVAAVVGYVADDGPGQPVVVLAPSKVGATSLPPLSLPRAPSPLSLSVS